MKLAREGRIGEGSGSLYVRYLASCSASVATKDPRNGRLTAPRWTSGEKTLHVVLSTALSLQPRAWSVGVAGDGGSQ